MNTPQELEFLKSSLARLGAWAFKLEAAPPDTFKGAAEYRTFVYAWRKVYREYTLWARAYKLEMKYLQSKKQQEWAVLRQKLYPDDPRITVPAVKPQKLAAADVAWERLAAEFPELLKMAIPTLSSLSLGPTHWLELRAAGKRWARLHLKWSVLPKTHEP